MYSYDKWIYNITLWCCGKCPCYCFMLCLKRWKISTNGVSDHKLHLEVFILSFATENSLLLERIVQKLFYEKSTLLHRWNLFLSVLPFFKSFVFIVEQKGPHIHWAHRVLVENFQIFLACFMKFKVLNGKLCRCC